MRGLVSAGGGSSEKVAWVGITSGTTLEEEEDRSSFSSDGNRMGRGRVDVRERMGTRGWVFHHDGYSNLILGANNSGPVASLVEENFL